MAYLCVSIGQSNDKSKALIGHYKCVTWSRRQLVMNFVWEFSFWEKKMKRQRREQYIWGRVWCDPYCTGLCFGWEESLDGCFRIISDKHLISFFRIYWLTTYREKIIWKCEKCEKERERTGIKKMNWEDSHEWNKGFGFLMGYCPMGFRFGHGGITVSLVLKTPTHYSFFYLVALRRLTLFCRKEKNRSRKKGKEI